MYMNSQANPLVSVIINNYNYERFLPITIDSTLAQTYKNIEIVIVDDGSTDRSREIITSYGDRLIAVFKENGGQASSLNAGVKASSGDILCFLDADDLFSPDKVERVVQLFDRGEWQQQDILLNNFLVTIDRDGNPVEIDLVNDILSAPGEWQFLPELTGKAQFFENQLTLVSTPDLVYRFAAKYRFMPYLGVQTSGISISRSLASKVFPLPDKGVKISADVFLVKAAALAGNIYSTTQPLTKYRIHQNNNWYGNKTKQEFDEQRKFFLELDKFLNSKLKTLGKQEVFSYMESMIIKSYYRSYFGYRCSNRLFALAFKVIGWHLNLKTIKFFFKTVGLATYFQYKSLKATAK
jgi:glycosyltransferase involved in cell wall biosynthesis